jgi:hypothetical protein
VALEDDLRRLRREVEELQRRLDEGASERRRERDEHLQAVRTHVETSLTSMRVDFTQMRADIGAMRALQEEAKQWRTTIRRVEVDYEAEKRAEEMRAADDARAQRQLAMAQQAADVGTKIDQRISGDRQRKIAVYVACMTVGGTLLVAFVNAITSWLKPH